MSNSSSAKELVLYFLKVFDLRATASSFGKYTNQAKALLKAGYTVEEVKIVIEDIHSEMGDKIFSFGFINACIDSRMYKIKAQQKAQVAEDKARAELSKINVLSVTEQTDSSKRNASKLQRKKSFEVTLLEEE